MRTGAYVGKMGTNEELEARVADLEVCLTEVLAALKKWAKPKTVNLFVPVGSTDQSDFITIRNLLVEAYEKGVGSKYAFDGPRDAAAVKRLAAMTLPVQELLGRWVTAITASAAGRGTRSIAIFASRINDFAARSSPATPIVTSEDPYK